MSRIGRQPITLPAGVSVNLENDVVSVTGPKGTLSQPLLSGISMTQLGNVVTLTRSNDEAPTRGKHGLNRSLINNMVQGVSQGFTKQLELNGVGFRAVLAGSNLNLNLGFSHQVIFKIPSGVTVAIEQNIITISGIDKQQVGQVAAEIRALKKPEPYKGKGFKYVGERIIRKSGKSGKESA